MSAPADAPAPAGDPTGTGRDDAPRSSAAPLEPAGERTGSGVVPVVGTVLALCLLALSVVLVRDALVLLGVLGGTPWLQSVVEGVRGTAPATWMAPVGVLVALVGLWLASRAFARRRRSELRLTSRTAVTTEPRDVARLSSAAARDVDGVLDASTSASRRSVTVTVSSTADDGSVSEAVQRAVTDRLAPLERAPSVRVKVEEGQR